MNKLTAKARRAGIRHIVLNYGGVYFRSVDDWYRVVVNTWPSGYVDSPCKNTVKSELFRMVARHEMTHRTKERGCYRWELFSLTRKA